MAADCSRRSSGRSTAIVACLANLSRGVEVVFVGDDGCAQKAREKVPVLLAREGRDFFPLRTCRAGLAHSSSVEVVGAMWPNTVKNVRRGLCCGFCRMISIEKHSEQQEVFSFVNSICLSGFSMVFQLPNKANTRSCTVFDINSEDTMPLKDYTCFCLFWEAEFYS